MITTIQVPLLPDSEDISNMIGDVNDDIDVLDFEVWDSVLVIRHLKGAGLDFKRGDLRVEISKDEAIKLARLLVFAFKI